jgi:chromosomal replication initiation ATPase DnaA
VRFGRKHHTTVIHQCSEGQVLQEVASAALESGRNGATA